MDEVFGAENFRNEIIWYYSTLGRPGDRFAQKHDTILCYGVSEGTLFNESEARVPYSKDYIASHFRDKDESGRICRKRFDAGKWRTYYPEDGMIPNDVWEIPYENSMSKERTAYPTQKPEALLARIIKASSRRGDIVLDVFCGCGTTASVAQKLGRRWIMADINHGAIQTTSKRLQDIVAKQKDEKDEPVPANKSFRIIKVNNYDLQIQHNEALEFAIDKIGIQRTPQDRFFEGVVGDRLVKIIPLNRPANIADLDSIDREIADIRPDDTRDILVVALGAEINVRPWIEEKNKLRQHAGNNHYELKDLRETGFFEHRPAEADIAVKKEGEKVKVEIRDFHSPTICARLDIANERAVIRAEIPDFRSQIDCVHIDLNYNGEVFNVDFSDLPKKKTDLVEGIYEFDENTCGERVAVKVIDMLGEEVLVATEL